MEQKRILLKLSGEYISKEDKTGIDFDKLLKISLIIKKFVDKGLEIAIVIGGGNFWRGRTNQMMDSCTSDYIGMLATTMNALALNDALKQTGVDSRVQTSIEMRQISELYIRDRALKHLDKKRVIALIKGLAFAYVGLVLFLAAVDSTYMGIGFKIGSLLSSSNVFVIVVIAFVIGALTVLAEPAIKILISQVEEMTNGLVKKRSLLISKKEVIL